MFKSIAMKLLDPEYENNEEVAVENKLQGIVNIDYDDKEKSSKKSKKCC